MFPTQKNFLENHQCASLCLTLMHLCTNFVLVFYWTTMDKLEFTDWSQVNWIFDCGEIADRDFLTENKDFKNTSSNLHLAKHVILEQPLN